MQAFENDLAQRDEDDEDERGEHARAARDAQPLRLLHAAREREVVRHDAERVDDDEERSRILQQLARVHRAQ